MKTKKDIINDIIDSGAIYVKTSISIQSCSAEIAIRDIEDADYLPPNFYWEQCISGLDEEDY